MIYLLFQILLLLLLAAICGGALAWWWLHRHAEEEIELVGGGPVSRDDFRSSLDALTTSIKEIPETDLEPVARRLADIEVLKDRIMDLEGAVTSASSGLDALTAGSLSRVDDRLEILAGKIDDTPAPDFSPLAARLDVLERAITGGPDLGPVEARLDRVERAVGALPRPDLTPVGARLEAIERALSSLPAPQRVDLEPTLARLARLEAKLAETGETQRGAQKAEFDALSASIASLSSSLSAQRGPDLQPLQQRLFSIEQGLNALRATERAAGPVEQKLSTLENLILSLRGDLGRFAGLEPVERRLASLQEAVADMPPPDLTPVVASVRAMDNRLDLGAVENRLTAIEYGLAAVHHMLRSRSDASASRVELEARLEGGGAAAANVDLRAVQRPPAPVRPSRENDPINIARRADDQANLLTEAAFGDGDDLQRIDGVGPMLSELLNEIGVFYFWQVAEWTEEEVAWVDGMLMHFRGRIDRDNWVGQARELAALEDTADRPDGLMPLDEAPF